MCTKVALWPGALRAMASRRGLGEASCPGSVQVLQPLAGSTALDPPREGHGGLAVSEPPSSETCLGFRDGAT